MEEGIRFERMVGRPTAVFKTAGLNHSPNPPKYGRRESNPQRADFKSDASAVPPLPPKALGGGIEPPTYALTVRRSTTELPQKRYPDRDSNPDKVNQNHLCYRYTIGVKGGNDTTLTLPVACEPPCIHLHHVSIKRSALGLCYQL